MERHSVSYKLPAARGNMLTYDGLWPTAIKLNPLWKTEVSKSAWIKPCLWTQKIKILKKWNNTWQYYDFTNVYHEWQSYDVWFLSYGVQWTEFFVIWIVFYPFNPPNNPKNQNFENMKKTPEHIIIVTAVMARNDTLSTKAWYKIEKHS